MSIEKILLSIIESKLKKNIVPCKLYIELYDVLICSNLYGHRNIVLNNIYYIFKKYYRNKLRCNINIRKNEIITINMLIYILKLIIPKGYNVHEQQSRNASQELYDKSINLPWFEYIEQSLIQMDKSKQSDIIKLNVYKKFLYDMKLIMPSIGENREKAIRNITKYIHKYYIGVAFRNYRNMKLYNVDIYAKIISDYSV